MKGGRGHTHITQKAYNGPKLRGEMVKLDEVTDCERCQGQGIQDHCGEEENEHEWGVWVQD